MYLWTEGPNIHNSREKAVYILTEGRNIHIFYSMNKVHTVKNVGEASEGSEMEKSLC